MSATPSPHDAALKLINSPVAIIGVAAEGRRGGLTAAWLVRVSLDPPMLLVSVGHERHTHGLMAAATEFTVSLPGEDQVDVARLFGLHSQRDRDKWAETDHVLLGAGAPALAVCSARFLCRSTGRFTTGDHDCFLGEITFSEVVDGPPALPLRGEDYRP